MVSTQRFLGFCSYLGLRYRGYQEQKEGLAATRTIQFVLESVLSQIVKDRVKISTCSRTDAGVNAYSLPFQFTLETSQISGRPVFSSTERLKKALNSQLRDEDVKVNGLQLVPAGFNVHKECIDKEYLYFIEAGLGDKLWNPLHQHKLAYPLSPTLNTSLIRSALEIFLGKHDFSNFTVRSSIPIPKPRRSITSAYLIEEAPSYAEPQVQKLVLGFIAPGFLRHQIRCMVEAVKDIGEGNYAVEDLRKALENEGRAEIGRKLAPAKGLFLKRVRIRNIEETGGETGKENSEGSDYNEDNGEFPKGQEEI